MKLTSVYHFLLPVYHLAPIQVASLVSYNAAMFLIDKLICDWLWENLPVTHKDNYLEKCN